MLKKGAKMGTVAYLENELLCDGFDDDEEPTNASYFRHILNDNYWPPSCRSVQSLPA
jgi:hypothetical protein